MPSSRDASSLPHPVVSSMFRVGQVIDRRYVLKRQIACGTTAMLFEAEHAHTGRRLVLKGLLTEVSQEPLVRKRLLLEARALEMCRSSSVVEVLDAGLDRNDPYITLELLEGRSLDTVLTARSKLSLQAAVSILTDLCSALTVVHRAGLVHRNVKPSNLFIIHEGTPQERLKLLDFSIVSFTSPADAGMSPDVGEHLGTPAYIPPEQALTLPVDPRADLYSAMIVFFECLTGQLPFPAGSLDGAPTLLSWLAPGLPHALDEVVTRALSRDLGDRFASATELSRAVQEASGLKPASPSLNPKAAAPGPRTFTRAPYATPCRVVNDEGRSFDGRVVDVSEGGVMAILTTTPATDQSVQLRFCLPISGRPIAPQAVVRWERKARGQSAIGLEFEAIPDEARDELRRFVAFMSSKGLDLPSRPHQAPSEMSVMAPLPSVRSGFAR